MGGNDRVTSLTAAVPGPAISVARVLRRVLSRDRRVAHRVSTGYASAAHAVRRATGHVVATGPFAGMRYVDRAGVSWPGILSADAPFLLGSYEAELHGCVEAAIARGYERVVDVGCAEGYYAVGFAMRLPGAEVFGFDSDPAARALCRHMARMNGVADRVRVEGEATPDRLREVLLPGTLLVCDCEGCELHLLDPEQVPQLRDVDLIVELHDFLLAGVTDTLRQRFAGSHDIETIAAVTRDPRPYERWLGDVPRWVHPWVVSEFRGGGVEPHHAEWGLFRRRAGTT